MKKEASKLTDPPRRGRRRADAPSGREALLTAARKVFARRGFEGAGLRDIAADAGVDMALVARIFGSKAALWQAVVEQLAEAQSRHREQVLRLAQDPTLTPTQSLARYIELFTVISWEMPEFAALLVQELSNPGERLDSINRVLIEPFIAAATPIIRRAMDAGDIRATSPGLFLQILFSGIAVPLLAPAMRNDMAEGERLRDALAKEAVRIFNPNKR